MVIANDLRKGDYIEVDNIIYEVLEYQHVKPGKGPAYVKTKLRNLLEGNTVDKSFRSDEKVELVRLEEIPVQFLYRDGTEFHFMDQKSYDQFTLNLNQLGDAVKFLTEGMTITLLSYKEKFLTIRLPTFVDLKVTYTEPGVRGDTVSNVMKPATLETGATIKVPLFINEGDVIRVDTRTGEYLERVKIGGEEVGKK